MEIGKINKLKVIDITDKGVYLEGGEEGHLFVPNRELQEKPAIGDELDVFVYRNAKRDAVASGIIPYAIAGEFDYLMVNEVSAAGALLDWGIAKDLFLPSREQTNKLKADRSYLVYVYYDEQTRQVIATMNIDKHLGLTKPEYKMNQKVDILVAKENEAGYRVIVDNAHWGIIYHSEIFEKVKYGMRTTGYVKCVREDGRIDVALQKQGFRATDSISSLILDELKQNGGFLPFNDKTDSQAIYDTFGCSKKNFKKTIGTLYHQRQILIEEDGISLVNEE
ncbi:MAG: S1-like domain-containing RNA-binding protein [Paludibacteraceae bacterium]|nr:S1-like domain-containing RNA-binding protein [Paludibacteraceae bacterium]